MGISHLFSFSLSVLINLRRMTTEFTLDYKKRDSCCSGGAQGRAGQGQGWTNLCCPSCCLDLLAQLLYATGNAAPQCC